MTYGQRGWARYKSCFNFFELMVDGFDGNVYSSSSSLQTRHRSLTRRAVNRCKYLFRERQVLAQVLEKEISLRLASQKTRLN